MGRSREATIRTSRLLSAIVILQALLAFGPLALAGPPYVTDDPEPVEFRHWEIYLSIVPTRDSTGWSGSLPELEINYGPLPNVQLSITLPLAFSAPAAGKSTFGFGDVQLGGKYRFVTETENRPQIAFFPRINISTGNATRSLGGGHTTLFLPLWIQKSFGKWTVYGGSGYGINPGPGNRNWEYVGAVLQRRLSTRLTVGLESFHETSKSKFVPANTSINAGLICDLSDHFHLLGSIGRSVQGPAALISYAGISFTFGPKSGGTVSR